jgi:maltooligosyltrehalose trehalohydrolase
MELQRKYPIGAEVFKDRGVHFRVWAPECQKLSVCITNKHTDSDYQIFDLFNESNGYFSGQVHEASEGMLYKYLLNKEQLLPDPASFFQPSGPLGFSQIVDHNTYKWNNGFYNVPSRKIIYEMHIGTFTPEGTFHSACNFLEEISRLGITILELMPIAEFNGAFGWGYDGVQQFAPYHQYGSPDDFKQFIDLAHQFGLGVILDVVYNHLGSESSFFKVFSKDYFSTKYKNEWGQALNFDQENCLPVREYFITNAQFWVSEYHIDGFRFDATQQIFDQSTVNIIKEITETLHSNFPKKQCFFTAENEVQNARLLSNYGIDAIWNEDFHRTTTVALTSRNEAYFSDYKGTPQEILSCIKYGFLFQGQFCSWQNKPRGFPSLNLNSSNFINYIQNHDQVANTLRGVRINQITSPSEYRCFSALLLLCPQIPLIFQGQELGCDNPFFYFSDNPMKAERITSGRKTFLSQFKSIKNADGPLVPLPYTKEAFDLSKIDQSKRSHSNPIYTMYCDLIKIRLSDPIFAKNGPTFIDGAVIDENIFCIRYKGNNSSEDRLLICNIGIDTTLSSIPEPLIAPPDGHTWMNAWYSENTLYGGSGAQELFSENKYHLTGKTVYFLSTEIT